jgi:hypothetical protein
MVADVTIITAIYGDKYDHFIDGWSEAISNLTIQPKRIICSTDRLRDINAEQIVSEPASGWKWKSPWYWNTAAETTDTEWIWVLDIDDRIKPDALENLMEQTCDIWLVGIDVNGTENYLPPRLTNEQIATAQARLFGDIKVEKQQFEPLGGLPVTSGETHKLVAASTWDKWFYNIY